MDILIIAFEFPPLNSGGSHRPFKFVKWLGAFDVKPIVITPEVAAHRGRNLDEGMLDQLDDSVRIIRTPIQPAGRLDKLYESYYFNVLDRSAHRWKAHLFEAIEKVLKEESIDAMYVTAPPFSMAHLGKALKKRFQLPLLLDMRDAWSHWTITPYVSYLHYKQTLKKERTALTAADAILVTSAQTIKDFQRLHPSIPKERFHLITNAYDETPPVLSEELSISAAEKNRPLRIGYVGSFYYTPYQRHLMFAPWWKKKPHQFFQYAPRKEDWLYRSPYFFFKALQKLLQEAPALRDKIQVSFVGTIPDWLEKMIEEHKLSDIVELRGRVSHSEALAFQEQMDVLLLTSAKVIGGQDYSIAGKTFEYICRKKPILGFVCEGAQKRLLEDTGLAVLCPPDDIKASAHLLRALIEGKCTLRPNIPFIHSLHIRETTKKFAQIINSLTNVET